MKHYKILSSFKTQDYTTEISGSCDHLLCLIIVPSNSHLFYFNCVCVYFCSIFNMLQLDLASVYVLDTERLLGNYAMTW